MDLKSLREYAEKNDIPIIKPDAEMLIKNLVEKYKPQKILEIGTAIGYSAYVMLSCGSNTSKIYTIEIDEQRFFMAKQNLKELKVSDRAVCYLGDAKEILQNITGSYDMIFVDGPKGQYIHFLPYLLKVLNIGGLLVCDNVLYRGLVDGKVKMRRKSLTMITNLREFIENISTDKRLETEIFDIGDGVSVSRLKE